MKTQGISGSLVAAFTAIGLLACLVTAQAVAGHDDDTALLKALPASKISLADGIAQASKHGEAAISAKFEMDDSGKLALSVYTAEKGLLVDAEHNVLKELAGSPEMLPWAPAVEVFTDIPHVARASAQLTLMALSPRSLAQLVSAAQKESKGTVFSAIPKVEKGRALLVVSATRNGKVVTSHYDLLTGRPSK
jgi:hypothetical protein